MPGAVGAVGAGFNAAPQINSVSDAAQAFEAMLLKQLLSTMSASTKSSGLFGGGFEADLYSDMFASAVAQEAAGAQGGLSQMVQQALGVEERSSAMQGIRRAGIARGFSAYRAAVTGETASPSNAYLEGVTSGWLQGKASERWSVTGELSATDLSAGIVTDGVGGKATFNVEDAGGYKGYPKCNLFAFEMVRRAGYTVPVRARAHGWSYPGADAVAKMAEDGKTGGWGTVRTADGAASLDATALSGIPLVLASAAEGGAVGHMAVADRIHDVKRDAEGNITSLEYSGWDAASRGSRYARRVWRVKGVSGEGRGGLSNIQILQPSVAREGAQFVTLGGRPGASVLDASRISTDSAQGRVSRTDYLFEDVSGVLDEVSEAPK